MSSGSGSSSGSVGDVEAQYEKQLSYGDPDFDRSLLEGENLQRLETLSKVMSNRTAAEAKEGMDEKDFNLQRKLQNIVRKHEEQGIQLRSVGVMFKGLTAQGIDQAAAIAPSVGEVLRTIGSLPRVIKEKRKGKLRNIVEDFAGVVNKGEMLLVLGRPGAGCSTLLKCCAGETDQLQSVQGTISYDGMDQDTIKKRFNGDVIYNGEMDTHFPSLTVDQTLSFAAEVRTPKVRVDNMTRAEYIRYVRDLLATVFGLTHTFQTKVGNDFIRGVSGGERKRVSIAEVMAARPVMVSWDNATRGLDASTALEYAQAIRASTNLMQNVALVAIYQAGENIYKLFDKVTVLYLGRQVFFGPAQRARAYFEEMGWQCPPRQTTAEFLTAVTDPNGRFVKPGFESKVPRTAAEFEAYWRNSSDYQALMDEIENFEQTTDGQATFSKFAASAHQDKMKRMSAESSYTISYYHQLVACLKRGGQRVAGDKAYVITNSVANIVQSLITGSLFYNMANDTNGAFSRGGVIFFAILFTALTTMAEISTAYAQRPIVLKQRSYAFYHPSAEALGNLVSSWPTRVLTTLLFDIILYFISNLNRTPGQFFYFLLFTVVCGLTFASFFQMIAALTKTIEVANAVAGIGLLILAIYTGYVIPRPSMHPWFRWLSWVNPVSYSFEALMANEFHGRHMECTSSLVPQGSAYDNVSIDYKVCAVAGSVSGQDYVLGDDYLQASFEYKFDHFWRNFGVLMAFWIFFTAVYAIATEYIRPVASGGDVLLFKRGAKSRLIDGTVESFEEKSVGITNIDELQAPVDGLETTATRSTEVFSWQHVDYVIPIKGGKRKLLDDIQGYVKPGTMTALMGESGAGKTTLLNVLAQRIDFGVITGDMLVNGRPLDRSFQRRTGYVQQQDLHLAESTVREALKFSAELRQPASVPIKEKHEYVETIIGLLDMHDYADAVIGGIGRGLNVEQRKKLSIGVELAAKPSLLLFLDEPTSGLDSQSAWAIVTFLRKLANAGQSILCTIHQPSATLFEQFDRLLLLKKGGQTVYFGDIGKNSATIIDYFERNGAHQCGPDDNPAEYILDCIGAGATAEVHEDWHEKWKNSLEFHKTTEEISELQTKLAQLPKDENSELTSRYAVPWGMQMKAISVRTFKHYWRSPSYIAAKLTLCIIGGLFIGFTFWDIKYNITGVQNGLFAIFMAMIISAPLINQLQPRAIDLRELFEVRENASNTYHWTTMQLSILLAEIPYNIFCGTMFFMCFYWTTFFDRSPEVGGYVYFVYGVLFQLFYTTFGLAIAAISSNAATASVLTSLLFSFILQFCGVLQPKDAMPSFWVFVYRVSPLTYVVQSLLGAILHDKPIVCEENQFSIFQPVPGMTCGDYAGEFADISGGYINNLDATANCQYCRYEIGDSWLSTVNIKYAYHWRNIGLLCAYLIFNTAFIFVGFYVFRIMKWKLPFGKK
ncbi:ABC-2 type transporter-domain-containing protein [Dipodascopsis tothii]|uniref:ABC-2 type transporter-domain-containing protein n=1 Tax=Dipodascopsis tothii TaxID=44089 RepID=UPI0034CE5E6E